MKKEYKINNKLIKLVLPLFFINILQQLYSVVDIAFVGNIVGKNAITALSSAIMISFIINSVCMGITTGASVMISKFNGEHNKENIKHTIATLFSLSVIISFMLTIIILLSHKNIFEFMNVPLSALNYANDYIKIISFGIIFTFGYNAVYSILKGYEDSLSCLFFVILSTLVNIFLDYIFIYKLNLEVKGAAFATVISQGISFFCSYIYLRKKLLLKIRYKHMYMKKYYVINIIKIGLPCAVQMTILNISYLIITKILNGYGTTIASAAGIGLKINTFAALPCWAIGQAIINLVSYYYGARNINNIKKTIHISIIYAILSCFILIMIFQIYAYKIIGIFTTDIQVISEGVKYLRICCSINFVSYAVMYIMDSFMTGVSDSFTAMLNSILQAVIIRVSLSIILIEIFNISYIGIYIAEFISPIIPMVVGIIYYLRFIKTKEIV